MREKSSKIPKSYMMKMKKDDEELLQSDGVLQFEIYPGSWELQMYLPRILAVPSNTVFLS